MRDAVLSAFSVGQTVPMKGERLPSAHAASAGEVFY
jgi:hypothetical protein